jgi:hypothetical protein
VAAGSEGGKPRRLIPKVSVGCLQVPKPEALAAAEFASPPGELRAGTARVANQ